MKYLGDMKDAESSSAKTGVLLVNLGTPDRPVCPSLRKYLSEFLMDPRVIELPGLFRNLLVNGIIINVRSHKSAAIYRKIWTEQGSPLLVNSSALAEKVADKLGSAYQVKIAMRYGNPSVADTVSELHQQGIRDLVVLPLYPQYSGSTGGSAFDAIAKVMSRLRWVPNLRFVNAYHHRPDYIAAVGESIKSHWQTHGRAQKLLMSFHGVPQKFITQGDPYQQQCTDSAQRIADYLMLQDDQWMLVFQSRFGAEQWLQPYCDLTLQGLPQQGVTSVDIVCPGFSADCLETLEEINQENREYFLESGGKQYNYIGCLNDSDAHADLMAAIVRNESP